MPIFIQPKGQAASVITSNARRRCRPSNQIPPRLTLQNRETADLRQVPVVTSTPVVNNDDHDTEAGLETVAKKSKKGSNKSKASKQEEERQERKRKAAVGARRKDTAKQLGARTNKRIDLTVEVPPSVRRACAQGQKPRNER